jgi:lysine-N-methylase
LIIRAILIDLVRDRSRPIWLRLLLIGVMCERLHRIHDEDAASALFAYYRQLLEDRVLETELESFPGNPKLKLEIVFELTNARIHDKTCGSRFHDIFWTFVEGIGTSAGSQPLDDVERLRLAESMYHYPFFERFPFILENYLVNYMFQNLFPWGREGSADFTQRSIFDEYLLMTTQFAWINTLLIGVAGHYKEAFTGDHVVQTIQSLTRAVEHYPHALNSVVELVNLKKLDNLKGMAILLRA